MATGTDAVFQNGTLRMIEQRIEVICVLQRPDPDSNRGMTVLQTVALPLGYRAIAGKLHEQHFNGQAEECQRRNGSVTYLMHRLLVAGT
jgi:hypothetical protein